MQVALAIFVGGGFGSLVRYFLSRWVMELSPTKLPWGTLSVNILACTVLGLFLLIFGKEAQKYPGWMAFGVVGFCGGFSTFSTFSLETLRLMRDGMMGWAVLNVLISVVACLLVLSALVRTQ